ncbi:MAG: non-homologous end-joining DNA ligase, partial [Candidatus Dormibacterales bacterium]
IVSLDHGSVRALSRKGEDVTRRYPELRSLADRAGSEVLLLDGELIALDESGRPSFEALQQRMGLNREADVRSAAPATPVYYMIFDVLHAGGRPTLSLPYRERRRLLESLELSGPSWQVPPSQEGEGQAMLDASRRQRMEGVIAKRLDSRYEPGVRSGAWLKVKNHLRQELVIGGWLPGQGRREGHLGALLVGYQEGDRLRYGGKVGTGYSDRDLERLATLLRPLQRHESPFGWGPPTPRGAIFVEPSLVGEFEFGEWTSQGLLRHPSFKGLREDKAASEVVRERPS